jgi:hypothetical protein
MNDVFQRFVENVASTGSKTRGAHEDHKPAYEYDQEVKSQPKKFSTRSPGLVKRGTPVKQHIQEIRSRVGTNIKAKDDGDEPIYFVIEDQWMVQTE